MRSFEQVWHFRRSEIFKQFRRYIDEEIILKITVSNVELKPVIKTIWSFAQKSYTM